MANVRRSLEELKRVQPAFDREKIEKASESDIARFEQEDESEAIVFVPPREIRRSLKMTQADFAAALKIPLATLQNWEQGRVVPDPAARALLTIVSKQAEAAFRALQSEDAIL
jgi:putative transcriptional regulator